MEHPLNNHWFVIVSPWGPPSIPTLDPESLERERVSLPPGELLWAEDLSVSLSWLCSSSIHWKASSSMLRSWASWLLIWREKCLGSRDASWCTLSSVHCEGWVRGITKESVGPRLPQEYKSSWNPGQAELSLLKIRSSRKAKNLIREGQRQPLEPFITL